MSAVAVWECSVVGIGFVSSIWLIGLIVRDNPFNRVFVTLSKEGNLAGFHLLHGLDVAIPRVVTEKTASESCSASTPKIS